MKKAMLFVLFFGLCFANSVDCAENSRRNRTPLRNNRQDSSKTFKYSTTTEKERPTLDDETKRLISEYRKNPTDENYNALRKKVESNYDKVLERKKAKLEELKQTAKHSNKVDEMQEIVDEMIKERENRINQTLSRFTDSRLRPGSRESKDGYLPVLGAAQNVNIAYTPVTNEEYNAYLKDIGKEAINGKSDYPVVSVSYNDAVAYCDWLTNKDGKTIYRLPTEQEWELAAGHMPKDADFNSGENKGLTSVKAYSKTLAACGAIDMWGNVWEWTSTQKDNNNYAVKGGCWSSKRTDCRTENRSESRDASKGYDTVGFRIIKEQNREKPFRRRDRE